MREYDSDKEVPSIRLSSLNSFEVEYILSLSPAKNDQGLNSFPIVPVPEILGRGRQYGDEDKAASNIIVAQNQRFRASEKGILEVLGYLDCFQANLVKGFIYHYRKNANKENFPLYRVTTDSRVFHFVRLDNNSSADLENAFSLLVYILKEAMIVLSTQPQELSTQSDRAQ
ncbi:hypothetical protein N7501_009708 [Penicillium viridicatum]|nr:hypothetical protein N7501_009708 [Penicillium viridicatum]